MLAGVIVVAVVAGGARRSGSPDPSAGPSSAVAPTAPAGRDTDRRDPDAAAPPSPDQPSDAGPHRGPDRPAARVGRPAPRLRRVPAAGSTTTEPTVEVLNRALSSAAAGAGHRAPSRGRRRHPRLRRRRAGLAARAPAGGLLRGCPRLGERDARRVRGGRRPVHRVGGRPAAGSAALPPSATPWTAADKAAERRPDRLRPGARGDDMRGVSGDPVPPTRHVTSRRIVAVRGESLEVRDDRVVGEAPLEIRAAGPRQEPVAVAVTMRTPGLRGRAGGRVPADRGPARRPGGRSARSAAIRASLSQPDDTIVVRLSRPFDDSKVAERHFVATASCGICGKASIDEVALRVRPAAGRAGRLALGRPRPAGPAARRAACLRRDRRAPRGGPVHARRAS